MGRIDRVRRNVVAMAGVLGIGAVTPVLDGYLTPAAAAADDAVPLRLYNSNTKERYDIHLFQGSQWNAAGLVVCDWMMRDWRENEVVHCDRRLYAALYVIQRFFNAQQVTINSGYRSEKTNSMLRARSLSETGGRASWMTPAINSMHTHARAVDFTVPGVDLRKVGDAVWAMNLGGLGRYDTFNHMDTGTRRTWGR